MNRCCYYCKQKKNTKNMEQINKNGCSCWCCDQCPKRKPKKCDVLDKIRGPLPSEMIRLPYKKAVVGDIIDGWRILARLPVDTVIVRRAG